MKAENVARPIDAEPGDVKMEDLDGMEDDDEDDEDEDMEEVS